MEPLRIKSGEVGLCLTGIETPFRDVNGKALSTGDIVAILTEREDGSLDYLGHLTVVVADESGPFVMGIKTVPLLGPTHWRVWKLKDYDDVIPGENWKDWGFSYEKAA